MAPVPVTEITSAFLFSAFNVNISSRLLLFFASAETVSPRRTLSPQTIEQCLLPLSVGSSSIDD